jgi:hypothetical protein
MEVIGNMVKEDFARAEAWLRENLLAQELLKRSHFKEKTFKALLFHYWSEDATFDEIAKKLRIQQPGAWKCYRRGTDSIIHSFFTLKLALYAGVLDLETAQLFIDDLLDFVSFRRGEVDDEEFRERIERRMVELLRKFREKPPRRKTR